METDRLNDPLVSVCIPAYNVEQYIEATIKSVLVQTYLNIEIIIVDDGSSDQTFAIASRYANDVVRIIRQKNAGASAARNNAYRNSKGQFIKFLDGDDLINPEMIRQQMLLATGNDDCLVSGKWGRFYKDNLSSFKLNPEKCWQTSAPFEWICNSWEYYRPMTQPGIFLIPRKIIDRSGLWDECLSVLDDTEYFHRTITNCRQVIFCDGAILYYRSGINGLSGRRQHKHVQSAFDSIDKTTNILVTHFNNNQSRQLSANIWQSLIFEYYPSFSTLLRQAEKKVRDYGGATIKPNFGGHSILLNKLIGWRLTKRVRAFVNMMRSK